MRQFINLVENALTGSAYHITLSRNVPHILKDGLVPRSGPRARKLKGSQPAVYLFPSLEYAEMAFQNWLGDQFSETTKLALLKVTVPHTFEVFSDAPYECHVYEAIPASCISVQTLNLGGEENIDDVA